MTQAERAEALGITPRQLRRDEAKGCPKDLEGARTWRARNVPQKGESDNAGIVDETARLRAAQADLAELQALEKRGEVAPVADMEIAINEANVIARTQFDGLSGRIAAQLAAITGVDSAEVRQLVKDETDRILAAWADRLEGWARMVASGGAPAAGAEEDAGPVGGPESGAAAG
jgi:hypothetical protein